MIDKYNIYPWERRGEVMPWGYHRNIILLPYEPVTDDMRQEVEATPLYALIPPYRPGDWHFNVRSAVTIRGHFPDERVMVALPGKDHFEVRRYMSTLQADGFDAFAIPHEMGGIPVGHMAGFWESSQILREQVWYHIAGGSVEPVADVKGYWSWSEEGL